ncbi:lipoprotein Spr/probable lipoprotein NlpC [Pedobacter cryoconitis]|uniref:Lipoprotein Spr/probable lipoprotein NlpC n=1 Tax=Pedobacter cryoconitis TaxID=188932 RepID=A0A7W8YXW1_9SPHI|nr:NlpC/P60 family protein [Pedobacter cryoconitis]MBB5623795.1 lipoprotein Spr/probable lipoprotein NlpC [Pedobacter cryoconitis]MBB5645205.1 lipoprotein Spr/probable lipoprotein NlpC [Pedobacter cryoconitis]
MTLRSIRASHLIILLAAMAFLSSCGSRRSTVYKESRGAKAAEAMANVKSKQLYRFITDWTGVRYRLGGLDKRGIDCSGFALLLNKEIYGLNLPRRSKDQADVIKEKNVSQLKEGDLIFFSFGGNGIDHVGVYLNHGFFVHASTTRGVIVDDLSLPAYQRVLVKAGPVKD